MAKDKQYTAADIKNLTPIQHLRKRPNLTFGAETGNEEYPFSSMKGTAAREIIDNAGDELRAGHGKHMKVVFYKDNSFEVYDSGRGIPVDAGKLANGQPASGIFLSLGVLQSGSKFETDAKRFSSGLNGVGASSTNFMSKYFTVTVYRNKKQYDLHFKDGQPGIYDNPEDPANSKFTPVKDLTYVKESKDTRPAAEKKKFPTGTKVRSWLDDSLFPTEYPLDPQDIIIRLRGMAFLVPDITIEIINELNLIDGKPQHEVFHFEDGLVQFVELLQQDEPLNKDVLVFKTEGTYIEKNVLVQQKDGTTTSQSVERTVPIEVALRWGTGYDYKIESFVNTIRTRLGGIHENAFERAITNSFVSKWQSMRGLLRKNDEEPNFDDFSEGLTVVVSVQVSEPQFSSQSKEELKGREVQAAIKSALEKTFTDFANANKNYDTMKIIGEKVVQAAKNRQRARDQKELNRQANRISNKSSMPTKLVDCEVTHDSKSELYIVEGDSALSGLKAARSSKYQALLPIRGKILNTNKATKKQMMANKEIQDIINCLEAGIGEDFKISEARYQNIFIAADADVDGDNIACLILQLFYDLFRDTIEQGRLFRILTPLFVFELNNGEQYFAYNEEQREDVQAKLKGKKYKISRNKGLGEASRKILKQSGMDADTRMVQRITIEDVEEAQRYLDISMGSDVSIRKEWIEANPVEIIVD